jgi:AcrR family transcriptional regulator
MRKGESTRQRIIEKSAPIFNQKGFSGCSMQDVMEATGLEKGGLYRHFSGKEELAAEVFRYTVARAERLRGESVDPAQGAIDQLRFFVRRFVEIRSDIPGGCAIFNTAIGEDDGNPVLRGLALEALRTWKARLARIAERGIRDGQIRTGVVPRHVANVVIATLEGGLAMSRLEGSKNPLEDAQVALEQFLGGLAP